MHRPLIVVTGTGTEIGKTHTSVALLRRWGRVARVCGIKPVETGVPIGDEGDDARLLRLASTFHVKHAVVTFVPPISPHLAARLAGRPIDAHGIVDEVGRVRAKTDGVLVELAGGLFSPLGAGFANADLARALGPTAIVLIAPDRIGVLHDIAATTRAARTMGIVITGIFLSAPASPDASSGSNAAEVVEVTDVPVLATLPRAASSAIADLPEIGDALAKLLG